MRSVTHRKRASGPKFSKPSPPVSASTKYSLASTSMRCGKYRSSCSTEVIANHVLRLLQRKLGHDYSSDKGVVQQVRQQAASAAKAGSMA